MVGSGGSVLAASLDEVEVSLRLVRADLVSVNGELVRANAEIVRANGELEKAFASLAEAKARLELYNTTADAHLEEVGSNFNPTTTFPDGGVLPLDSLPVVGDMYLDNLEDLGLGGMDCDVGGGMDCDAGGLPTLGDPTSK